MSTKEGSMREGSDRVRKKLDEIRGNVKGVFKDLGQSTPRPLTERLGERQTLVLREPLIKTLRSKRKQT